MATGAPRIVLPRQKGREGIIWHLFSPCCVRIILRYPLWINVRMLSGALQERDRAGTEWVLLKKNPHRKEFFSFHHQNGKANNHHAGGLEL